MSSATAADPTAGRGVMLYDGQCPLCRKGRDIVHKLDWLGRMAFQDCRDTANLPPCAEPLDPKRLIEEMHVVTPDRQHAHAGYDAFRWMAWRLPLTWPVAPLMSLPGVPWVGHKVYLWVARNRFRLVPCADGACAVNLPKKAA